MPPKSSSSSNPRRSASPRKPRKKDAPNAEQEQIAPTSQASVNDDLDFGAGIVEDEPAPRSSSSDRTSAPAESEPVAKTRAPRAPRAPRRERAPKAAPEAAAVPTPAPAAPAPEPVVEQASFPSHYEDIDADFDDEDGGHDAPSSRSGEGEASTGGHDENDRRPRRRRRRRGRRNEGGNPQQSNQGGHSNQGGYSQGGGYSNQGGNSGGQGHSRQGGGNNRRRDQQQQQPRGRGGNTGNTRGRRISKFEQNAAPSEPVPTSGTIEGVLELHPKGYGFLRSAENDYGARETDAFVSSSFVEKHHLREGIKIKGEIGPGTRGQGPRLLTIDSIDGGSVEDYEKLKHFDTLTAINPFEQIKLETGPRPITMRVLDLLTPIGKGQRALIVAPPRSGKTMLLQDIANAVSKNHPEIHLIVLLIDERPEEVTEMRRTIRGEVIASSMDLDVESHVRISQLVIERGKRLAESGKDCFILLDSITRTARAFNKWMRGGRDSKIQTGGLDVRAMDIPRKMFGTARRFDEGGSLTVCATALIDTGSKMDDAIFQEFKGTGNMELVLSRDLAERRIWPALDISRSGTRREEKILDPELLDGITMLRRSLVSMNPTEAMDQLIRTLGKFDSNKEFLQKIRSVL